jgi:hypothetical protein
MTPPRVRILSDESDPKATHYHERFEHENAATN